MPVSSHCLYSKLQQLTLSAPRRILPTFLERSKTNFAHISNKKISVNTFVMMHDAHTHHFKVVANKYAYSTSFPAVLTYMCILIVEDDRRKRF